MTAPGAPAPSAATPRRAEPPVGPGAEPFWEATRQRRLVLPWCEACDHPFFYPRLVCPRCLSPAIAWWPAAGTGTVYAVTVEHRTDGVPFAEGAPFAVALVELDEGVRLLSNVVHCPPEEVTVGMPVAVCWEPLTDGRCLPLFEPAGARGMEHGPAGGEA